MGFFLQGCIPVATEDEFADQLFCLTFGSDGAFSRADVMDMEVRERFGYIERLAKARRKEKEEADRIRAAARARRK